MNRQEKARALIKRTGYADGGRTDADRDAIEFSGSQLDDLMHGKSMPSQMGSRSKRMNAAIGAEDYLRSQGKSERAAEDAGAVFRGHAYEDNTMSAGKKKTWDEREAEPTKTKYPGDEGYHGGGAVKRKR